MSLFRAATRCFQGAKARDNRVVPDNARPVPVAESTAKIARVEVTDRLQCIPEDAVVCETYETQRRIYQLVFVRDYMMRTIREQMNGVQTPTTEQLTPETLIVILHLIKDANDGIAALKRSLRAGGM